ncbi:MAG: methyltransferase [bacterium]|nr:methyltransferase [bacterium]
MDRRLEASDPSERPDSVLHRLMSGAWVAQSIYVAAKLRIADALASGPAPVDEVAERVGAQPAALFRLMRALASLGVLREVESNRFELTDVGTYLRSDVAGSMHALALTITEFDWDPWKQLLHSVRTGETAFELVHGKEPFDYLRDNDELRSVFSRAMTSYVTENGIAVAESYDFSHARTVVDVGGGHGTLLAAILAQHAHIDGILLDLPEVTEQARHELSSAGLEDRVTCVDGDFFTEVPAGKDVYVLASILHDWDAERARRILATCRRAMPEHARLLVIEAVIFPGNEPAFAKLLDLEMLVCFGGRERSLDEYAELFAATGFRMEKSFPLRAAATAIVAVPI